MEGNKRQASANQPMFTDILIEAERSINRKWFDRFSKGFRLTIFFHSIQLNTLFRCIIIFAMEH